MVFAQLKTIVNQIKNSQFGKHSFIYIATTVFSSGFGFVLVSILTNHLSKNDFGIIENFNSLSALLIPLMLFGNEVGLINFYSGKGDKKEFSITFYGILVQAVFLGVLCVCIPLHFFGVTRIVAFLAVVNASITAVTSIITTSFQLERKVINYSVNGICGALINFVSCIILLFFLKNFYVRLFAILISLTIMLFILFPNFYKTKISLEPFSIKNIKQFYKKGSVVVFSQLSGWLLDRVDRFQIAGILSLERLGVYGIGAQFAIIIMFVGSAISRAWQPYMIDKIKNGQKRQIQKAIVLIGLLLLIITTIGSLAISSYIRFFINPAFAEAATIAVLISVGYFFDGLWKLYCNIVVYENHFTIYSAINVISGITKVGINFYMIPKYGIIGAAVSNIFAYFFGFISNALYVHVKLRWFVTPPVKIVQ